MRRNYWVVVASALVIGVVTGCSDSLVAPAVAPNAAPVSMLMAPSGAPSLSLSGGDVANGSTTFTVGPWGGVFFVGNHAVYFPARSICDPATSTYGEGTWDTACTPLTRSITISAQVSTVGGGKAVDFTPELRFVPSSSPAQWVWIFMYTPEARSASNLSPFNILFASSLGAQPENDAALDASLRTYVDTRSGVSFRRIKHFSGYVVPAGNTCDPTTENCGSGPPAP
ncbi:MAG: hypothetical protein ABIV10_02695 [Gemmatimonadaceae bacterium]